MKFRLWTGSQACSCLQLPGVLSRVPGLLEALAQAGRPLGQFPVPSASTLGSQKALEVAVVDCCSSSRGHPKSNLACR
jgi:hypothetical protein